MKYQLLLFIIPMLLMILLGKIFDLLPTKNKLVLLGNRIIDFLTEKRLNVLLIRSNIISISLKTFQAIRLLFSLLCGLLMMLLSRSLLTSLLMVVVVYKIVYIILLINENNYFKKLNKELPYGLKTIIYLNYVYPVDNAIEKSISYVSPVFEKDFRNLLNDIDSNPNDFTPYQNLIDKYDGRLKQLDFYFRIIYRLGITSKDKDKLLSSLNESISNEINTVRYRKNNATNSTIQYLGMIPVGILVVMLTYILVLLSMQF